jgi:hypothetical protein
MTEAYRVVSNALFHINNRLLLRPWASGLTLYSPEVRQLQSGRIMTALAPEQQQHAQYFYTLITNLRHDRSFSSLFPSAGARFK